MPRKWKKPVGEFRRKYRSLLRTAPRRALYVFGFVSAGGAADHNKPLARNRVKKSIRTLAAVLAAAAVVAAMQLPPEIQADRYLVRAERQIEQQDYAGAKESMERILELQQEHGLEVPEEFLFRYAQILLRLDLYDEAAESVTKYLTLAGREGKHYREALQLLDEAEAAKVAVEAAVERERKKAEAAAEAARRWAEDLPEEARNRAEAAIAGMEFVWVPSGEFQMGSTSSEDSEQPVTQVRISRGYWLGKYEVTQGQWQALIGSNPSYYKSYGPNCPVESVSWEDVQEFIARLNALAGRDRYRLPTEAEWEYAARAGTSGDRYGSLNEIAWYRNNSGGRTQLVGQKAPNAWGFYDMLGNVWEWVAGWYGDYPGGFVTDPRGPGSGSSRVRRGGSWRDLAWDCRAPNRDDILPFFDLDSLGFRLLRTE